CANSSQVATTWIRELLNCLGQFEDCIVYLHICTLGQPEYLSIPITVDECYGRTKGISSRHIKAHAFTSIHCDTESTFDTIQDYSIV
ncbi:MAG TPA: hypothetical protein VGO47_01350, partial [Chlamydiales bacterium]|nr:hypothetical protein [Chlamydiales bacterium]